MINEARKSCSKNQGSNRIGQAAEAPPGLSGISRNCVICVIIRFESSFRAASAEEGKSLLFSHWGSSIRARTGIRERWPKWVGPHGASGKGKGAKGDGKGKVSFYYEMGTGKGMGKRKGNGDDEMGYGEGTGMGASADGCCSSRGGRSGAAS